MVDFLGLGAQKAGTTWLSEMLTMHPEVRFPGGKEVHFWSRHYERGYDWYKNLFTPETGIKKGEITPAYAFLSEEKIAEVHHHFPHVPLIYIIRNPIDRAWSSALMALNKVGQKADQTDDQWFLDHFKSEGSIKRGDYESCIRNWLQFFPRKQFLLLQYDEISNRPRELLKQVAGHIGIDASFYDDVTNKVLFKRVREGEKVELRPSLRVALEDMYAEKIVSLEVYLREF